MSHTPLAKNQYAQFTAIRKNACPTFSYKQTKVHEILGECMPFSYCLYHVLF